MVDKSKLDQMLANLRRFVGVLRTLAQESEATFLANTHKIGSAKYHFVVALGRSADIANHVIVSEGLRLPKDNADSFEVLAENGLISAEILEPLRNMARFRNQLVHRYSDVEDGLVREYLTTSLDELDRFAREITSPKW